MKSVYPVILIPDGNGYTVDIPDFDIMTQGDSIPEAIEMARDAISLMGVQFQDDGKSIPIASPLASVKSRSDEMVTLVDVDFAAYRRMLENRSVRKNCTIPGWLNEKAESAGINFSAVLQAALIEKLGLQS